MKLMKTMVCLALCGLSATCIAQSSPEDPSKNTGTAGQGKPMTGDATWDDLDSNKDGYLTKDELTGSPALVTHFKNVDTSGDGKVSMDEWKTYGTKDQH